jgi:seryl-tRNA synthetase
MSIVNIYTKIFNREIHRKLDILVRAQVKIIEMLKESAERENETMATIQEVVALIKPLKTKVEGLNILMDNMRKQIADLLAAAGGIPAEVQAQIDEVFIDAKALSDEITVAIDENVPPTPPEPEA